MTEASLELLQRMVQNMRRRLTRIERLLLSLQRSDSDRTEVETELQEQIDMLAERLDHIEQRD